MKNQPVKSSSHAVYMIRLHCVFVTKYRRPVINKKIQDFLNQAFEKVLNDWGCQLIEFGCESDHVHLLIDIKPTVKISELMNNLKSATSRRVRKVFKEHIEQYYWKPFFWHRAYYVGSVGEASLETIKQYVEAQYIKEEE